MLQVAIVEDDERERERLKECLGFLERDSEYSFAVSEFTTGAAFLDQYAPVYDIVFMDIEMPGINGMETARELRTLDGDVILIFVTNLAQYAIFGYEVEALDYILKPVNPYSFAMKVRRAAARAVRRTDDYIPVKVEGETVSVRKSSIRYMEVYGHYVIYHTTDGDYSEYTTLKEAAGKVNRRSFVNVNRSVLVNLRYVSSVSRDSVQVGEENLTISRPQKKAFLEAMSEYMGGKR